MEQQNNINTIKQQKQALLKRVQGLANKEINPNKKKLIPKLWEKIINDFQAETWYALQKMWKKLENWNTVLEETLLQMPAKQMKALLPMFAKWNKKRWWLFNFLKKVLNKFYDIAKKDEEGKILDNTISDVKNKRKVVKENTENVKNKRKVVNENLDVEKNKGKILDERIKKLEAEKKALEDKKGD